MAMRALRARAAWPGGRVALDDAGAVTLFGLRFPNRIGLAAGFDKSARYVELLGRLGFGFIEVGTITPRPQPGNPRPNVFRLREDEALVNRMGFPNEGAEAAVRRLERRRYKGICGVNIGKNFDTPLESAAGDYVTCLRAVYGTADYVALNVSSPNTPGLRTLQTTQALRELYGAVAAERERLQLRHGRRMPLLVKLAPDLSDADLADIAAALRSLGADGVIATNTTLARPAALRSRHAREQGGLSGRPLHERSLHVVRTLRAALGPGVPIIGVGGVFDAQGARAMRSAGADLVQVYTGLVYRGPGLVQELRCAVAAG